MLSSCPIKNQVKIWTTDTLKSVSIGEENLLTKCRGINLIESATTTAGVTVPCVSDTQECKKGCVVMDEEPGEERFIAGIEVTRGGEPACNQPPVLREKTTTIN
jgi:hypothetical protein